MQVSKLSVTNLTIFILSRLKTNLLLANHLLLDREICLTLQKSSNCLLQIMTLVSSASMSYNKKSFSVEDNLCTLRTVKTLESTL